MSALESGQTPGKRGKKQDDAFNQVIINRLSEIHNDIGKVHARVDELARDSSIAIAELIKAQANSLTKEDCEKCQDERDKTEEKKRSVSPRMALACTVGGGVVGNILYRVPWDTIRRFVRGG